MLDLKLDRAPATPKDAATIIVVRDGRETVEVFCVERSKQSRFLGGAIVFPGGKLDPSDAAAEWQGLATPPRPLRASATAFTSDEAHLRALAVAACRETLEEAAMLHLARDGRPASVTQEDLFALRTRLASDAEALRTFLRERGLVLDLGALVPLSRWITPEAEACRYDARFFVAKAPSDQTGAHDEHETMASFWASPAEVLRRWEKGEVELAPPTHCTLAQLASCTTASAALTLAERSGLDPICPRLVRQVEGPLETLALTLPGDPEHEVKERRIDGPSRYVLRGERWLPEDAPR